MTPSSLVFMLFCNPFPLSVGWTSQWLVANEQNMQKWQDVISKIRLKDSGFHLLHLPLLPSHGCHVMSFPMERPRAKNWVMPQSNSPKETQQPLQWAWKWILPRMRPQKADTLITTSRDPEPESPVIYQCSGSWTKVNCKIIKCYFSY